jgi:NhaP-type Na+/H+ or K+/H+ antiporter
MTNDLILLGLFLLGGWFVYAEMREGAKAKVRHFGKHVAFFMPFLLFMLFGTIIFDHYDYPTGIVILIGMAGYYLARKRWMKPPAPRV